MIAAVWVVLGVSAGGGLYGTGRILARDDMPLQRQSRRQQLGELTGGLRGLFAQAAATARRLLPDRPASHARSAR